MLRAKGVVKRCLDCVAVARDKPEIILFVVNILRRKANFSTFTLRQCSPFYVIRTERAKLRLARLPIHD